MFSHCASGTVEGALAIMVGSAAPCPEGQSLKAPQPRAVAISATNCPAASAGDRTGADDHSEGAVDQPTERLAPIIVEELLEALGAINRAGGTCSVIEEQNAQKILGLADRAL
jgi:hypothetical protein